MSVELFLDSLKSPATREKYNRYLKFYGIDRLHSKDPQSDIIDFIIKLKKEGKSYAAINNYVAALKSYYQINDVVLNIKKISRFMPEQVRTRKDRAYYHSEIKKMLDVSDLRMKAVILVMASSGVRIGAIPFLKLNNLEDNKLVIYENTKEEYFTFITPESRKAVDSYLDMRSRYGEKLTDDSPLIREEFNIRSIIGKARFMKVTGIKFQLDSIAKRSGVRNPDVVLSHGFRKFFTTQCVNAKINPEIREMLLGHKIGLASAYYRPTEEEMYSEYEKAIDALTINEENRLRRKVEILEVEKTRMDRIELQIKELQEMKKK